MTFIGKIIPLRVAMSDPEFLCQTFRSPSSPPDIISCSDLSRMALKI